MLQVILTQLEFNCIILIMKKIPCLFYTHTYDTSLLLCTCFMHWYSILYSCFCICHPWYQNDLPKPQEREVILSLPFFPNSPLRQPSKISPSMLALPTPTSRIYFIFLRMSVPLLTSCIPALQFSLQSYSASFPFFLL